MKKRWSRRRCSMGVFVCLFFEEFTDQTRAHRVPFIRLNHNTGSSAAMLSGTQYMLQKNPCTRLPLLAFGILIAVTVTTESGLGT